MTIGEGLIQWLYGFGDIEAEDLIQTDRLDGTEGSYGLYRQPTREETVFIDGSRDVSCFVFFHCTHIQNNITGFFFHHSYCLIHTDLAIGNFFRRDSASCQQKRRH